jgi:hypothetical protein
VRPETARFAAACAALATAIAVGAGAATLGELVLAFTWGEYRAPLICKVGGEPVLGTRLVRVKPVRRTSHRKMNRLEFYDLETPIGTQCIDDFGREERNVIGVLTLFHEGRTDRSDIGDHELREALRSRGFLELQIAAGRLRVGSPAEPASGYPEIDFKGGTARFSLVKPGSDGWRRLAEYGSPRKLHLVVAGPDGTELSFDLVQFEL